MSLPKVLAGPILRRCEATKVYVWIATSIPMEFNGSIHEIRPGRKPEVIETPISQHAESKRVQMGKNLFVHLVEIAKENPNNLSLEPSKTEVRYREEIPGRQRRRLQRQAKASFPLGKILAYDLAATLKTGETVKLSNLVKLSDITYSPYPLPTFLI